MQYNVNNALPNLVILCRIWPHMVKLNQKAHAKSTKCLCYPFFKSKYSKNKRIVDSDWIDNVEMNIENLCFEFGIALWLQLRPRYITSLSSVYYAYGPWKYDHKMHKPFARSLKIMIELPMSNGCIPMAHTCFNNNMYFNTRCEANIICAMVENSRSIVTHTHGQWWGQIFNTKA